MRKRGSAGFTLLEVMMATALLAVGTTSIFMMLTAGNAFHVKRRRQQRVSQVLDEARFFAQSKVNNFTSTSARRVPGGDGGRIAEQGSRLFANYRFELRFSAVNLDVPDAGFSVDITVRTADESSYEHSIVVARDTIPMEEFATSKTYEAERAGEADSSKGTKETK